MKFIEKNKFTLYFVFYFENPKNFFQKILKKFTFHQNIVSIQKLIFSKKAVKLKYFLKGLKCKKFILSV